MEPQRERYRRLPGRRRGFIFGSSLWLGADHLLLVKSARFSEEYKRFFMRDIQAIVTAKAARFHISTRAALIGFLWSVACAVWMASGLRLAWIPWVAAAGLIVAWIFVSGWCSCRCRIYTAVSSEELKSLYRIWTARRFLRELEPYVAQEQGSIEGNWAEAVEDQPVGPPAEGRVGLMLPDGGAPLPVEALPPPAAQTVRTPVAYLFAGVLCAGGLADLLTFKASPAAGRWILLGFLLLQMAAAVAVLVQTYRGLLRPAMRNLAMVTLGATGIWYYAVQIGMGMIIGMQNAASQNPKAVPNMDGMVFANYPWPRAIGGAIFLLLGLAGAILLLRGDRAAERTSFNV